MDQALFPLLYQINARIWLRELAQQTGKPTTFRDVSDAQLDRIAALGVDWVYLLGVWQTGAIGRDVSRTQPQWREEYRRILPDFMEEDIVGSPFAVQKYQVHADLGGNDALLDLRRRLGERGIRLMLDFVPNHTARDHRWVEEAPDLYVHGSEVDLARQPYNYCRVERTAGPMVLAHGRDPYFPGWPDTIQLDYRNPRVGEAMLGELQTVAELCDGVRCDMAMLILPDIFQRTWGTSQQHPSAVSFWPNAIGVIRHRFPHFVFMAEAYWDLEWTLQQQGFDFTYDKRLYDRLTMQDAGAVRGHLHAEFDFQRKSVRFLENHDEPRAASMFSPEIHQAAAMVTFLVPGLRFLHEGQLEGWRTRASVHLGRRLSEPVDEKLAGFYRRLLDALRRRALRSGRWQLLSCSSAWPGNQTCDRFLAFSWDNGEDEWLLAVVNFGTARGQCHVRLPNANWAGRTLLFRDLMGTGLYERSGESLAIEGLYVDLPEWGYHLFEVTPLTEPAAESRHD